MLDIPITQARHQLTSMPGRLAKDKGAVAITRRGKPVLAMMPWDLYESIIETLEIMEDKELMDVLRKDIQALKQGKKIKTTPLEKVKQKLKL